MVGRGDVYLVSLDPTQGHEIQKTRPCLLVSPDEMNRTLGTVIVAPMTTHGRPLPSRVSIAFQRKRGFVVLDQLRTVDQTRLLKRLGSVEKATLTRVLDVLAEMFAP